MNFTEKELIETLFKLLENTKEKRTLTNQNYNNSYYNDTFKPLLNLGQAGEQLALKHLIKYYNLDDDNIKLKFNDTNKYDIKLNGVKYEVKIDEKAIKTNNLFIEFKSNNKPSGITTTKAQYYNFILPYPIPIYLLIETFKLKKLIEELKYKFIYQPNNINNYTSGYIFDINVIIKNSILI